MAWPGLSKNYFFNIFQIVFIKKKSIPFFRVYLAIQFMAPEHFQTCCPSFPEVPIYRAPVWPIHRATVWPIHRVPVWPIHQTKCHLSSHTYQSVWSLSPSPLCHIASLEIGACILCRLKEVAKIYSDHLTTKRRDLKNVLTTFKSLLLDFFWIFFFWISFGFFF